MKRGGFTLLEVLVALGMFVLAVGGLAFALDRAFAANNYLRRDEEIRQQLESLLDESMALPVSVLEQGREAGPDVLGVKYSVTAEPTFEFRNKDDEELGGLWRVTVRAEWTEQGEKQTWQESHLRYQP
jgi:type II secretory pathway pseudopilin PulG